MDKTLTLIARFLTVGYQILFRGVLPPSCRFYPSCSDFALQAIGAHGFWKGAPRALRRLLSCHPFNTGYGRTRTP